MKKLNINCQIELQNSSKIKVETIFTDQDEFDCDLSILYLKKNLAAAIEQLILQMSEDEIRAACQQSERREKILHQIKNQQAKTVRKRIKESEKMFIPEVSVIKDGKETQIKIDPKKSITETVNERNKFLKELADACQSLKLKNKKVNQTNIAIELFPKSSNVYEDLKRALKKAGWNYKDVLKAIKETEQNF